VTPIQNAVAQALKSLSERSSFTEAILAKKIREENRINTGKKAGIAMADLEAAVTFLAESEQIFFSLRLNSANDILILKSDTTELLNEETRHRRHASEKSMQVLSNHDLASTSKNSKKQKPHRTERVKLNIYDYEE